MSEKRSRFFNRISAQLALLVLASLFAIHALITASFILYHHVEGAREFDESPAELVALVKLVAAAPADERAPLIAQIAHGFPQFRLQAAAAAPVATSPNDDRELDFLEHHLGSGFGLRATAADAGGVRTLAIRLPDGSSLAARLPPRHEPPFFAGPTALTILFVVVCVSLLALWAARALRTPLSRIAQAAEGFDLDGHPAELPERGPDEIRAVARALNRMRARIKRLVDDRTRMLAAMGHDLRTPITRLRLRSEFIADEELRAQMLRDLDQMRAMTDGVLAFLRDGQLHGGMTSVDIVSVLRTVSDQYADLEYDVTYQGPDHVTISARPDDLQRAVANLIDNAVRHGEHTVVRLVVDAKGVRIEVEDDGPGIPNERKDAMLEAFVRGEAARTMDDRAGFGLGLSIARAIAEAHGGTIALRDRLPHGLVACITLPATAGTQLAA
jgi:signal transduction histidine kinase